MYLILAALDLHCCAWAFASCRKRGCFSLWCVDFSLRRLLTLQSTGFRHTGFRSCGSGTLEHVLSSCGAWAQLLHGTWGLPRLGIEPMSPALGSGFSTNGPPGMSQNIFLEHRHAHLPGVLMHGEISWFAVTCCFQDFQLPHRFFSKIAWESVCLAHFSSHFTVKGHLMCKYSTFAPALETSYTSKEKKKG